MQNVPAIRRAWIIDVVTLAQARAAFTLCAVSSITHRSALVFQAMSEIHSQNVIKLRLHHVRFIRLEENLLVFNESQIHHSITTARDEVLKDPCLPSPCGFNAKCSNGICSCLPEYQGDPYYGCRPECVLNSECPRDKACIRSKCVDPCPGICGQGGLCDVINHIPMCSCPPGQTGNAFIACRIIESMNRSHISYTILTTKIDCLINNDCDFLFYSVIVPFSPSKDKSMQSITMRSK